jgi:hypothetical protein
MSAEILYHHQHHREDYETMRKIFPYIETAALVRTSPGLLA